MQRNGLFSCILYPCLLNPRDRGDTETPNGEVKILFYKETCCSYSYTDSISVDLGKKRSGDHGNAIVTTSKTVLFSLFIIIFLVQIHLINFPNTDHPNVAHLNVDPHLIE